MRRNQKKDPKPFDLESSILNEFEFRTVNRPENPVRSQDDSDFLPG
jgi:hypothetical protein